MKQERFKNPGTTNLQCWPMRAHIQYGMFHGGFHLGLGKRWRAGVGGKIAKGPLSIIVTIHVLWTCQPAYLRCRPGPLMLETGESVTIHRFFLPIISGKGEPVTLSHSPLIPPSDIIWKELPWSSIMLAHCWVHRSFWLGNKLKKCLRFSKDMLCAIISHWLAVCAYSNTILSKIFSYMYTSGLTMELRFLWPSETSKGRQSLWELQIKVLRVRNHGNLVKYRPVFSVANLKAITWDATVLLLHVPVGMLIYSIMLTTR